MVKPGSGSWVSGDTNTSGNPLTIDDIIALAKGEDVHDDALTELAVRAGGRDELLVLIFDAALRLLKSSAEKAETAQQDSHDFHRQFEADMAKLHQSQRETRGMLEELVNG